MAHSKFIQVEAVSIRVTTPDGKQHDELELFALDEQGKVYRYGFQVGGGWLEMT